MDFDVSEKELFLKKFKLHLLPDYIKKLKSVDVKFLSNESHYDFENEVIKKKKEILSKCIMENRESSIPFDISSLKISNIKNVSVNDLNLSIDSDILEVAKFLLPNFVGNISRLDFHFVNKEDEKEFEIELERIIKLYPQDQTLHLNLSQILPLDLSSYSEKEINYRIKPNKYSKNKKYKEKEDYDLSETNYSEKNNTLKCNSKESIDNLDIKPKEKKLGSYKKIDESSKKFNDSLNSTKNSNDNNFLPLNNKKNDLDIYERSLTFDKNFLTMLKLPQFKEIYTKFIKKIQKKIHITMDKQTITFNSKTNEIVKTFEKNLIIFQNKVIKKEILIENEKNLIGIVNSQRILKLIKGKRIIMIRNLNNIKILSFEEQTEELENYLNSNKFFTIFLDEICPFYVDLEDRKTFLKDYVEGFLIRYISFVETNKLNENLIILFHFKKKEQEKEKEIIIEKLKQLKYFQIFVKNEINYQNFLKYIEKIQKKYQIYFVMEKNNKIFNFFGLKEDIANFFKKDFGIFLLEFEFKVLRILMNKGNNIPKIIQNYKFQMDKHFIEFNFDSMLEIDNFISKIIIKYL